MELNEVFGGYEITEREPIVHRSGTLCPRCGDPCEVVGRCPSCGRMSAAIAPESAINVDEHFAHVAEVVRWARGRGRAA